MSLLVVVYSCSNLILQDLLCVFITMPPKVRIEHIKVILVNTSQENFSLCPCQCPFARQYFKIRTSIPNLLVVILRLVHPKVDQ